METKRCFLALPLGPSWVLEVTQLEEQLRERGLAAPCVRPENAHLTLHFFGDLTPPRIASAQAAAAASCRAHPPLSVQLKGLGAFPSLRAARVLWVGLAGDIEPMAALHNTLSKELARHGFQPEARPFAAHVTLARFRCPPGGLEVKAIESLKAFDGKAREVLREVVLFESLLRPEGPRYVPLAAFPLGAERPSEEGPLPPLTSS